MSEVNDLDALLDKWEGFLPTSVAILLTHEASRLAAALDLRDAEIERLRAALERIERWFEEFPPSGKYWDESTKQTPMSYGAAFGSNGERDYMRNVARQALAPNQPAAGKETGKC